ncbi:SPARC-like protein 1 [Hypomesus transpacificus]|uniref:SPARC-like protein 1 n=1 Tax=Hypomesus transpacificus TaxID=137520 RepID=UPI001F07EDCC|nr:SPARC-like protein 1 [Hypomesus transpacificus]
MLCMETRFLLVCLLASAFAVSVKGKPHEKHQASVKSSHTTTEKDAVSEGADKGQVLPTNVKASSLEQEDEELSSQDNANADKEEEEREEGDEEGKRSTPVLLSQEELVDLLQKESMEEVAAEEVGGEEEGKVEIESAGTVEEVEEVEVEGELEAEVEGEVEGEVEKEGEDEEVVSVKEVEAEVKGEEETDKNAQEEESEEEEDSEEEEEAADKQKEEEEEESLAVDGEGEQGADVKEIGSSTESEINDMEYTMPLKTQTPEGKPLADDTQLLLEEKKLDEVKASGKKEEETATEEEIPTSIDDYESQQDVQNTEALEDEEVSDEGKLPEENKNPGKDSQAVPQENSSTREEDNLEVDQDSKTSMELDGSREEDKEKESIRHTKRKIRKIKKNLRVRKHPAQRDEASMDTQRDEASQDSQKSEGQVEHSLPADNAVYKPQRKRAGKWAPSVGMNPVQVRARVDLYPTRPSLWASIHRGEASSDPCDTFHCKRGKTCKLGEDNKPTCVCQQPSACPHSKSDVDHVCGSDNTTYDTSCDLFATKCNLEGTRRGHRLHLDYTGPCKLIAPCLSSELVQFPLRMRDWLKNVLLQLYEHDSKTPGFLTSKQRYRVRKIFESERRLHAGDHPIELLAQDFEKNYNMYIYPVHWQFAQMDQHPADRLLSHTELAPLRVPLVPMEHCTSLFFQECDVDKDKQVSFREWAHCFGIKNEDMDVNLLF